MTDGWVLTENGAVLRVFREPQAFAHDGVQHPVDVFRLWGADELAAIGVSPFIADPRPDETQVRVLYSRHAKVNGAWRETYVTEPIPRAEIDARNAAIRHANALVAIDQKERMGIRRMRETLLKLAQAALPANDPDRVALEAVEAAIAAERAKLAP